MSKALLILDEMPESCWECPCFRNDSVDGVHYYQCNITLRSKETTVECRMKDCPLLTEGEIYDIDYSPWVPVSERLPEVDEDGDSDYILISLENFSLPVIGRYAIDQDGDGSFHKGNEERTLLSYGLFVNAWMPLPKSYRESE